jgi:hypothetical protein
MNLYIIGNGFDLDLGLQTSYNSFIQSEDFKKLLAKSSSNNLASHINNYFKRQKDQWCDLEITLGSYVNEFCNVHPDVLKSQFAELKSELKNYLKKQSANLSFENQVNSRSFKLLNIIFEGILNQTETTVLNFNYTDTVKLGLHYINNGQVLEMGTLKYINPHGTLSTDIALGVNDDFLRDGGRAYSYLRKAYSYNYNLNHWTKTYQRANKIFIFGHSLSIVDSDILHPMFEYYLEDRSIGRTITILDTKDSNDRINDKISELTSGKIASFKLDNEILINPF